MGGEESGVRKKEFWETGKVDGGFFSVLIVKHMYGNESTHYSPDSLCDCRLANGPFGAGKNTPCSFDNARGQKKGDFNEARVGSKVDAS